MILGAGLAIGCHVMMASSAFAISFETMKEKVGEELLAQNILAGNEVQVDIRHLRMNMSSVQGTLNEERFNKLLSGKEVVIKDVVLDRKYKRFSFLFNVKDVERQCWLKLLLDTRQVR